MARALRAFRGPEPQCHLTVHDGRCVELNDANRAAWSAGGSAMLKDATLSGTRSEIRHRLNDDYAA